MTIPNEWSVPIGLAAIITPIVFMICIDALFDLLDRKRDHHE